MGNDVPLVTWFLIFSSLPQPPPLAECWGCSYVLTLNQDTLKASWNGQLTCIQFRIYLSFQKISIFLKKVGKEWREGNGLMVRFQIKQSINILWCTWQLCSWKSQCVFKLCQRVWFCERTWKFGGACEGLWGVDSSVLARTVMHISGHLASWSSSLGWGQHPHCGENWIHALRCPERSL